MDLGFTIGGVLEEARERQYGARPIRVIVVAMESEEESNVTSASCLDDRHAQAVALVGCLTRLIGTDVSGR